MPRYFFHLTFGDRLVPDEEGIELPGRTAAREEALAAARELTARASDDNRRSRWASWFLQVADEQGGFLRVPLGYPALELVPASNADSELVQQKMEPGPTIARVPANAEGILVIIQRILAQRHQTARLLQENQQLRQELAGQFAVSQTARMRARELVTLAQAAYVQAIALRAGHVERR